MKSVLAAAACVAAFAFASPAFAQANSDTFTASSFSMTVGKEPVKSVRSIEFNAEQPTGMATGRAAAGATTFMLKVTVSRSSSRIFDDWGAQSGALRDIEVNFLDRQGKMAGGYALGKCAVAGWDWKLDAANNAIASETWAISCGTAKRV